eukprot:COSAG06_NODE_2440_length_6872_cov_135.458586_6_plen_170_part_00
MCFEFKNSALASTAEIFHEVIVSFEKENGRLPRQAQDRQKRRIGVEKDVRCFSFPAGVPGADGDAAGDGADAAGAGGEKRRRGASGGGGGGRGRADGALARGADGSVAGEGRGVEVVPGALVAQLASDEGAHGRGVLGHARQFEGRRLMFYIYGLWYGELNLNSLRHAR